MFEKLNKLTSIISINKKKLNQIIKDPFEKFCVKDIQVLEANDTGLINYCTIGPIQNQISFENSNFDKILSGIIEKFKTYTADKRYKNFEKLINLLENFFIL